MPSFFLKNLKNTLQDRGIFPLKRLGQNFLTDESALLKVVKAADLTSDDFILEIGPGTGILTREIAKKAGKVIAIEKDPRMTAFLEEALKDYKNIEIVRADVLKINLGTWLGKGQKQTYKIVANLPFYITAPVIRKFLEDERPPESMVFMVQKEVAQRICAQPPDMSILAVSVQFYARPEIISFIPKEAFWPKPKVDSAIIKIVPKKNTAIQDNRLFFKIVKAGFAQPRKQILNNLSKSLKLDKEKTKIWLLENKIQPSQRAETLNIKDWVELAKTFSPVLR